MTAKGLTDLEEVVEDNVGGLSQDEIERMVGDLETMGLHVICLGRRGIMTVKVAE